MAYFKYKGFSADNKPAAGFVEAVTKDQAIKLLKDKQLFVVSMEEVKKQIFSSAVEKIKKISFGDIVNFTRQLSTMVVAGLSIPDSLHILRAQAENPQFAEILDDVGRNIVGGSNFAEALSKYPAYFTPIYISLVRAGEASGMLDKVLVQLADTLEAQRALRSKIVGALIYPAIIMGGMVLVVVIMMVVVMPKLTDLYKDFGIQLPFTTQLLIGISNFMIHYWWLVIGIIVGIVYGFRKWKQTEMGTYVVDTFVLKIPLFGDIQKKTILVEFTRTLGMLIGAGIHILNALRILKGSLNNVLFRDAIEDISKKVEKGFQLGDTVASHKVFPPIVSQMLKVGEQTGKLDETLNRLSQYFQIETENLVKGMTTAIEPIIMVILGVGVGFIVISVITPIYNLTAQFK